MSYSRKINYDNHGVNLTLDVSNGVFYSDISNEEVIRYLKGVFSNKERFIGRFINNFNKVFEVTNNSDYDVRDLMNSFIEMYDDVSPFTYREAFNFTTDNGDDDERQMFRAKLFSSIDITEMIKNLSHTRIKTDGKAVRHKTFTKNGDFAGYVDYDVIYETHSVDCSDLGLDENKYVVKCWCTSTNEEHWLWIDEKYKDSPLEAIASTFMVHSNIIPHIKEIKRQGDMLLVEMKENVKPEGEIVSLTSEQYFSLLTCQS